MSDFKYDGMDQRLKNLINRATGGDELTLAFFGGSITQGALSTSHEKCYSKRVFDWFSNSFPNAVFHYVNGGIGGTDSHFGVSRVERDCLIYQPDLVVVDFSVNDKDTDHFSETFEGLIRRIITWGSDPAVIILSNVFYDTGESVENRHLEIAKHYKIPLVSIRDTIYKRMREGEFSRIDISPDGLHPNDRGHQMVADVITDFIRDNYCKNKNDFFITRHFGDADLPAALTKNRYEYAKRHTIENTNPRLRGFSADTDEKMGHLDFFKNGWIGKSGDDEIEFLINARAAAVQFRRTIRRPAQRAELIVDDKADSGIILDGNFDEDWGDCLYLQNIFEYDERREHKIVIKVLDDQGNDLTPFYLMSIITA